MDQLSRNITSTKSSLDQARSRLQSAEAEAKRKVGADVDNFQGSITRGSLTIQHTLESTQSFLTAIEDVPDAAKTVNMAPQVEWLQESLNDISNSLDDAHAAARRALDATMQSNYTLSDIRHDVSGKSEQLTKYHSEATQMASQARGALSSSEQTVKSIQVQVSSKEGQIRSTNDAAYNKRRERTEVQERIRHTGGTIANAERELEYRKREARAGKIMAGIGLVGAFVTFGASLALTGVGAGVALVNTRRADELKDELKDLRAKESELNNEVNQYTRQVENLEREKRSLETMVRGHERELAERKRKHEEYNQRIQEASYLQSEVSTLRSQANATISDIAEATAKLQEAKEALDEVSELVKSKSVEVSQSSGILEVLILAFVWILGSDKRKTREFAKQKRALREVSETLERVQSDMPLLLGPARQVRLLDSRPAWRGRGVEQGANSDLKAIPAIAYREDPSTT